MYRSSSKFYRANEFLPERWLAEARVDPTSPFYHDDLAAVQAFSIGTWSCIGKQLAYAELRVILAKLVWNFDMSSPVNGRDVDWGRQKAWVLIEKQPFDVRLQDVR
jgi:cytochrome P450